MIIASETSLSSILRDQNVHNLMQLSPKPWDRNAPRIYLSISWNRKAAIASYAIVGNVDMKMFFLTNAHDVDPCWRCDLHYIEAVLPEICEFVESYNILSPIILTCTQTLAQRFTNGIKNKEKLVSAACVGEPPIYEHFRRRGGYSIVYLSDDYMWNIFNHYRLAWHLANINRCSGQKVIHTWGAESE